MDLANATVIFNSDQQLEGNMAEYSINAPQKSAVLGSDAHSFFTIRQSANSGGGPMPPLNRSCQRIPQTQLGRELVTFGCASYRKRSRLSTEGTK